MSRWRVSFPGLYEISKDELHFFIDSLPKRGYKASTQTDYRHLAKIFFRDLKGEMFVSFIKVGTPKPPVTCDQLLTQEELSRLMQACENIRDSAIIMTLYETAARPQELLTLKRSSIIFDERGGLVSIQQSKTVVRAIRIVNAVPLLANWIENHPLKDRDAPLWVDLSANTRYEPLGQVGLNRLLRRLASKAHIEKRIWPYLFRHTRITDLIRLGMNDATLRKFAGWTPDSDAPAHYEHLVSEDVDEAILKLHGVSESRPAIHVKSPKKCVRCGNMTPFDTELCSRCGAAMSLEAALKLDVQKEKELEVQKILAENLPLLQAFIDIAKSMHAVEEAKEYRMKPSSKIRNIPSFRELALASNRKTSQS